MTQAAGGGNKAPFGSEERAQAGFDWLTENAAKCAQARATAKAEELRLATVRAFLENNAPGEFSKSQAARERWAKTQPQYHDQIKRYEEAVAEDHRLYILSKAAEMAVSAWQTRSRNERTKDRV